MAYIISCSGNKSCLSREKTLKSSINNLGFFSELMDARIELIDKLGIKLNWAETLPAYKLYTGKLYNKVFETNWEKKETSVVIVSALFGLIKHNELIPYYNVVITDRIPTTNEVISEYWRKKNINKYIDGLNDVDLLFSKYRKAFNENGDPVGIIPNILWRDKYGSHKGEWLNQQLNKL